MFSGRPLLDHATNYWQNFGARLYSIYAFHLPKGEER